ncbi:MAG: electron transfer flavoprotein subunit alpha/FixB family protein [Acidobacteriota bacterium]
MSGDLWCVIEHRGGHVDPDSLQLLGAARKVGGRAIALVCAAEAEGLTSQVAAHADQVLVLRNAALEKFTPDGYAQAIVPLAQQRAPSAIFTLHSHFLGRDLAPVLAARLDAGLITDAIDMEDDEGIRVQRLVYRRKLVATQRCLTEGPAVITCQRGAFVATPAGDAADIETLEVDIDAAAIRWTVGDFEAAEAQAGDITEAEVVVAAGRGVGSEENLEAVKALAAALGGALAASRPIVDNGWLERGLQVGSSGKTVRPRLYIALGISGAIQHVVGMRDSDVIVAVNKDPRAPIFEYADYGIVADLMDIVPPLTEAIKRLRG